MAGRRSPDDPRPSATRVRCARDRPQLASICTRIRSACRSPTCTSFDAYVGGCPTNVSVGTRRLGLRSALLTAVGDDQVGEFVIAFLERERVETRFIPRKPGRRTSAVILTIQPPDTFPLTFYRDNCADRELTIDDVRARAGRRQPRSSS